MLFLGKKNKRGNFYPRPPRGGRRSTPRSRCSRRVFLSTPSARRATRARGDTGQMDKFLSTPSARRATAATPAGWWNIAYFYPRPPRGGRRGRSAFAFCVPDFYPRPPRGGRPTASVGRQTIILFLSTPSARRATQTVIFNLDSNEFLSTPSARRATPALLPPAKALQISIHALREEGDSKNRDKISIFKQIIQHSARI